MGAHLLRFHANLPHEESEILHRLTALPSMRRFMDGLEPETPLPTRQALHGLEGLLLVPTVQHWQLLNAAMLLGRHQNGDGGVWAYLSTDAKDTVAVDATAQAVRVWSIVDAKRFYGEIKKALGYLDDQFEDAGLKDPTDGKRATHASLFALQAASFAERGGNPSELI
ncbi:MAG: hypothetical protein M5R36_04775 [Deltaproteobacteria bacterium]|nr:hypothetical protein [Deltaproteobacteria bacterium]